MLCQRWGCPPSVLLAEDAAMIYRLLWYAEQRAVQTSSASPVAPAHGRPATAGNAWEAELAMMPMETLGGK